MKYSKQIFLIVVFMVCSSLAYATPTIKLGEEEGSILPSIKLGLSDLYCRLTGCTMQGDINMGDHSIINANWINATYVNITMQLNSTQIINPPWLETGVFEGNLTLYYNTSDTYNKTEVDNILPIADCPEGYVVQNTTTGGVECITIESTIYYANNSAVTGGSYTDAELINATFYEGDGFYLNFTEGAGADPLNVTFNFTGVEDFTELIVREYYLGSGSHHIAVQFWNYDDSEWETHFDFVGQAGYTTLEIPMYDSDEHINGGPVQVRFHHIQNGVTSHRLNFGFIWLVDGSTIGGSTNLAGYAKYNSGYNNYVGSGNTTSAYFNGDGSQLQNVNASGGTDTWTTNQTNYIPYTGADKEINLSNQNITSSSGETKMWFSGGTLMVGR